MANANTIIATGAKTIIDLSDGKMLSVHLGSNHPRFQIKDSNSGTDVYTPDWSGVNTHLSVTPVIYANNTPVQLDDTHLSTAWTRKEGSGSASALVTGETVTNNVLTVSQNKLSSISSGLLTYLVTVTYVDPDTSLPITATAEISFALVKTGSSAKTCWISGEQVFKYDQQAQVTPSSITLTAHLQGVTMSKWRYFNENTSTWMDYPTTPDNGSISGETLVVKPGGDHAAVWFNDRASIKAVTSDENVYDVTSLYKITDGTRGDPASIVFLTNENIGFSADKDGKIAATTATCNVVAYSGTTKVTPTVGTISGDITGMTISKGSASNNEIPITITIAANATLGGEGNQHGTLSVPITSPVSTILKINWTKVNTGATGENGQNAIVFSVYAPNGEVFQNQQGTLLLSTQAYDGSTPISSGATYQWYRYESGTWNTITGANLYTYTVNGSDVNALASFKCAMTYKNKTYSDVITLEDKTDNYQATIDSTAGDVFKNTVGSTYLICHLWQNAQPVDALKSTTYSNTAPTSPAEGDYYYQKQTPTAQDRKAGTKLMRYNGSSWVDVTTDQTYGHTKTYTWYRRDMNGNPYSEDNGGSFATGKVIYVDGDDVTNKTVFVCEVQ